jgi:hypothetical protein
MFVVYNSRRSLFSCNHRRKLTTILAITKLNALRQLDFTHCFKRFSCAMSQLPCQVMYLKSASVVKAAGDNSCLYHSLSYNLNHEEMYSNVYDGNNVYDLVNDYIRDNHSKYNWTSPDMCETFAEAIVGDGFNTSDYYVRMSLNSSWGGMIEICAVAEMFHVNIQIFENYADLKRRFKWMGTFKYSLHHVNTTSLYILYTGNNHYDSLIDIVNANKNNSDVSVVGDSQLPAIIDSSSSIEKRCSQIGDVVTTHTRKRLPCKRFLDVITDSPQLKRNRSAENEKR